MANTDIIFLLEGEDSLQQVEQAPYETEDLLQRLIKKHPELLAGHQIDQEDPPRWLLVSREMGVPDADGGANLWSVDHLFLDQYGIPTFVEVKRASDTRLRREVVGQMLDYAANAQGYWLAEGGKKPWPSSTLPARLHGSLSPAFLPFRRLQMVTNSLGKSLGGSPPAGKPTTSLSVALSTPILRNVSTEPISQQFTGMGLLDTAWFEPK